MSDDSRGVSLSTTKQGEAIKFAWQSGDDGAAYLVDPEPLRRASDNVRNVLGHIADQYANGDGDYRRSLNALAQAGAELMAVALTTRDGTYREDIVGVLGLKKRGTALTIFSDSTVEVPWNFIYAGNLLELKSSNSIDDFADFWHQLFKVRIRFSNGSMAPRRTISRERIKTLLALHRARFVKARDFLTELSPALRAKIDKLLKYEAGETTDWIDCRAKWQTIKGEDSILYIFAHRNEGGKLCLEEEGKIRQDQPNKYELTTGGFLEMFRKDNATAHKSSTLCFVNGCRTAGGSWGNSLLTATSAPGFQGFIGSEAEIPNVAATQYAVEFLYSLLEDHDTVDVAYEKAKSACFPLSLWYSCYAQPQFRIE